jgi:mannosyltransferase OCH1-like enzyme
LVYFCNIASALYKLKKGSNFGRTYKAHPPSGTFRPPQEGRSQHLSIPMDDNDDKITLENDEELKRPLYSSGHTQFQTLPDRLRGLIIRALSLAKNCSEDALSRFRHASPKSRFAIRLLLPFFVFLFIIGVAWNHHRPSISLGATTSLESKYYFWEKEGPERDLRQRLAELVPYDPKARWNHNIIQSWRTHLNQTPEYASWEIHKGDFSHLFYVDADQETCIRNLSDHNLHDIEFAYFQLMKKIIVRADFFRYFSIFAFGGIWADADTWLRKPFEDWLALASPSPSSKSSRAKLESKIGMIVGIEYEHSQTLIQYVFAARQGHPVLLELIAGIIEKAPEIARGIDKGEFKVGEVLGTTGPSQFTRIIRHWIKKRWDPDFNVTAEWRDLRQPKVFGDILVLPQYAFGGNQPYHPDHHDDKPGSHDDRTLVSHEYRNSWGGDRKV